MNTTVSSVLVEEKKLFKRGLIAPSYFLKEILSKTDIVKVIKKYLPLKKKAGEYYCLCPFHTESTPSFTVTPTKQFYHCFGCGAHGNVLKFLVEYTGTNFQEAIKTLAKEAGLKPTYGKIYKEDYFVCFERAKQNIEMCRSRLQSAIDTQSEWLSDRHCSRDYEIRTCRGQIPCMEVIVEKYRNIVSIIMEADELRYSNFYGKSLQEVINEGCQE